MGKEERNGQLSKEAQKRLHWLTGLAAPTKDYRPAGSNFNEPYILAKIYRVRTKKKLGHKLSRLLSYLINVSYLNRVIVEVENEGWFYCTVDKMEREADYDRNQQTYLLSELKGAGFIELKKKAAKRDGRAVRFIRIKLLELVMAINEAEERAENGN